MTKTDFMEKYGDVKVKFCSYYKFTFTYEALLPDGKRLTCNYGGNSDDIYGLSVSPDVEETVNSVDPFSGSVFDNGKEIEDFYDY